MAKLAMSRAYGKTGALTMIWSSSSILNAIGGGLLIGLAAGLFLLGLGRIAGVSGLCARAFGIASTGAPRPLAGAFVIGLPVGAAAAANFSEQGVTRLPGSFAILIAGGFLVGVGTWLGSGCTSGHGICGVSRLAPRSLVATAVFMVTGVGTVTLMRVLGTGWR